MSDMWDWFQHKQIADNARRSSDAGLDARSALKRVDEWYGQSFLDTQLPVSA